MDLPALDAHGFAGADVDGLAVDRPTRDALEGLDEPVTTDIDGEKMMFRNRGKIRQFFTLNNLRAGGTVRITRGGPYEYDVQPLRT